MDRRGVKRGRGRREAADLDDVMYGIHAVDEALAAGEKLRKIFVGDDRRRDPIVKRLLDAANAQNVPVRFEDRGFFAQFPYKAHQSVVAYGEPFGYCTLEDILFDRSRTEPLLLVLLDHITDPHNAGAIIRTAEGAGAHGVVLPDRRSAGVNATVRKAAAGAAAHIPIARVANLNQAVRTLKKAGVWVFGADLKPDSISMVEADFKRDTAIVIGAEGAGLSALTARECDYLVRIPMRGRIESLNASVAAAVLLYEAVRQRSL